jgi:hypothetical protein
VLLEQEMSETPGWLKTIQDRFGPLVWLITAVLTPAITGLVIVWNVYLFPLLKSQLHDAIQTEVRTAIATSHQEDRLVLEKDEKTLENYHSLFEQIKQKYENELDSTYYMEKTFDIEPGESDNASIKNQEVLSTFFYFVEKDLVKLYIWSSGSSGITTDMEISINDGAHKTLGDFNKPSWSNIDITPVVKLSSALSGYQYIGIGENVYNISIIPKPKLIKKRELTKISDKSRKPSESEAKDPKQVTIYALVIVRRSPFPP